jgi:hypothetical protein
MVGYGWWDLATSYWLTEAGSDIAAEEARLTGFQRRLTGYSVHFQKRCGRFTDPSLENAIAELFGAMTGGQFRSRDRKRDIDRAETVSVCAADSIGCQARSCRGEQMAFNLGAMSRRGSARSCLGVEQFPRKT